MALKTFFVSGFPGFIATKIIKQLLSEDSESSFELLVHPSQLDLAREAVRKLVAVGNGSPDRFSLLPGDITVANLGLNEATLARLRGSITHVFHLAAIYDLAVPYEFAQKVNVVGTDNINKFVLGLQHLQRYIYFSTAYVSGDRPGKILETELECGQSFKNFYESTKYEAEVLVQRIRDKVPTTIIRPGIVMGDSKTGDTVKFDGPYFVMRFLDKFARFPIPYVGKGDVDFNLVPVDYVVNAACYLAQSPKGENHVYHLTDPRPYKARDAFQLICSELIGKKPSFTLPLPVVSELLSIPAFRRWVMVEKETLEYFQLKAQYDCTQAAADLAGSGFECPDLADYIKVAVQFYKDHKNDPNKMILVDRGGKRRGMGGQKSGYRGHHWDSEGNITQRG